MLEENFIRKCLKTFHVIKKSETRAKVSQDCVSIDEVTPDVTAGQNKSSEQNIALQYACAPAGPVV